MKVSDLDVPKHDIKSYSDQNKSEFTKEKAEKIDEEMFPKYDDFGKLEVNEPKF